MSLRTKSTWVLEHFQGQWFHHFSGELFQCLSSLSVKKFLLVSNLNLPWHVDWLAFNTSPLYEKDIYSWARWGRRWVYSVAGITLNLEYPYPLSVIKKDLYVELLNDGCTVHYVWIGKCYSSFWGKVVRTLCFRWRLRMMITDWK